MKNNPISTHKHSHTYTSSSTVKKVNCFFIWRENYTLAFYAFTYIYRLAQWKCVSISDESRIISKSKILNRKCFALKFQFNLMQ